MELPTIQDIIAYMTEPDAWYYRVGVLILVLIAIKRFFLKSLKVLFFLLLLGIVFYLALSFLATGGG